MNHPVFQHWDNVKLNDIADDLSAGTDAVDDDTSPWHPGAFWDQSQSGSTFSGRHQLTSGLHL